MSIPMTIWLQAEGLSMPPRTPWPHQTKSRDDFFAAVAAGKRRICITGPTGSGKTNTMQMMTREVLEQEKNALLYTNRRALIDQLKAEFAKGKFEFGVRQSGAEDRLDRPFQISSIQTEHSRSIKAKTWDLHDLSDGGLCSIDEVHVNCGPKASDILNKHYEQGAILCGWTATPIDLYPTFDHLIVSGTVSEVTSCGALVPTVHYGPDEPDFRKHDLTEDVTESAAKKYMNQPGLFGRLVESYRKHNPKQVPTILFAPGVKESIWLADQFNRAGIRAAHIDGDAIWVDGAWTETGPAARKELKEMAESGWVKIVCNRFVMREGLDWPFLGCAILATVFGSLGSYLQSVGRIKRAYPGKDRAIVIDHGGAWWRMGSTNADRVWDLSWTDRIHRGMREEKFRSKQEREPIRCPECAQILSRRKCPCGWESSLWKPSRPVVMANGQLREHKGDIFPTRRRSTRPDTAKLWQQMYYRLRNAKKRSFTFRQLEGFFAHEYRYFPERNLKFMPQNSIDWFRELKEVPTERLR